ncbi:hypothetical protein LTR36_004939 [Oleoguttula mirabilis]|uniref:Uncharacterized protein n=1 Tax=Oleoguttula mirabilis TaxID=1507867 RepID=A0AAV9JVC2_9PEZI|nr:hypothetical protein LTR36_004939 [Oleoguttula mirabilis]
MTTEVFWYTESITISAWSSTSTASTVAVNREGTFTPVYVFGSEPISISPSTFAITNSHYVGSFTPQPPCCQYTSAWAADCGICEIYGGTVQLLYWPSTSATTNGSLTNYTGTITAPPVTATTLGLTLTSPSVYISFQQAFATNECGAVGQNHTGFVLSMRPQDVSSVVGNIAPKSEPLNYTNLDFANVVLDVAVYEDQCFDLCQGPFAPEEYRPYLSIPSAIRGLDPAWASCQPNLYGSYDPPIPLQAADSVAGVSTVAGTSKPTQSVSAAPSSTPAAVTPSATSSAVAEQTSATASIAGPSGYTSASGTSLVASSSQMTAELSPGASDPSANDPTASPSAESAASTDVPPPHQAASDASTYEPTTAVSQGSTPSANTASTPLAAGDPSTYDPGTPSDPQPTTTANLPATQLGASDTSVDDSTSATTQPSDASSTTGSANSAGSPAVTTIVGLGSLAVTVVSYGSNAQAETSQAPVYKISDPAHNPILTADGTTYSSLSSGSGIQVAADGVTSTIPSVPAVTTASQEGNVGYTVAGHTISANGSPATISGTVYSALPSGGGIQIVAAGSTSSIEYAATAGEPYVVQGSTLSVGGSAITVSGTVYSALPSDGGVQVVASGQTSTLIRLSAPAGSIASASSASYVILGSTLSAGGSAATISGTVYSALPSGAGVQTLGDGVTSTVPGTMISQSSNFVIAGTTYSAGGQALVTDGTTYSVLPSNDGVQATAAGVTQTIFAADGSVLSLAQSVSAAPVYNSPASQSHMPTISKLGNGDVLVVSSTLTPGGPLATIEGQVYSLASDGILSIGAESTSGPSQPVNSLVGLIMSATNESAAAQSSGTPSASLAGQISSSSKIVTGSSSVGDAGSESSGVSSASGTASSTATGVATAMVRKPSIAMIAIMLASLCAICLVDL